MCIRTLKFKSTKKKKKYCFYTKNNGSENLKLQLPTINTIKIPS